MKNDEWEDLDDTVQLFYREEADKLLQDFLVCTRDWSAWGYDTMSADDFHEAAIDSAILEDTAKELYLFTMNKQTIAFMKKYGTEFYMHTKLQVGDTVTVDGDSGFCDRNKDCVKALITKWDTDTGLPYTVVVLEDGQEFDTRTGYALTPPKAYYIEELREGK